MARSGGRYTAAKKKGGEPKRVEGTEPHPDGDAPRGSDGKRLDRAAVPAPEPAAVAETNGEGSVNGS
jgi:hypothetical protein